MVVTNLIKGEKFGYENEPPISYLFSAGEQRGLLRPSKKSQAFSINLCL
jgi:hypothetical protein